MTLHAIYYYSVYLRVAIEPHIGAIMQYTTIILCCGLQCTAIAVTVVRLRMMHEAHPGTSQDLFQSAGHDSQKLTSPLTASFAEWL